MSRFQDKGTLVAFAKRVVGERLTSLEQDVRCCLAGNAPFPALLYCFATVDLLGALYAGNATSSADTSKQASAFMQKFLGYSAESCTLLLSVFRHKIVHLAQPRAVTHDGGRTISWLIAHDEPSTHLQLVALPPGHEVDVSDSWTIPVSHRFSVSIRTFVRDVCAAARGPRGYLSALEQDAGLQDHFETAIEQVHDPNE